jgi:ectoine hydroxylase-related dioxygenase (phytanoyl-CoA dioxygenase family)
MSDCAFSLSEEQVRFFQTFGYLGFPGLMADRIDEITNAFEAVWQERGGGHGGQPHNGTARSCIVPFIDQSEALSSLIDDPRILALAKTLLGDDFNYMGSDGNYYVGDTGWHSDGWHPQGKPQHLKIAFYLDPVGRDSGALRVIPGSHHDGDAYAKALQDQIRNSPEQWGIDGAQVPAVALETQPGDLVCFNHNTKHAAFGGSARRRMFTINLCQRYPQEGLQDLQNYIAGAARFWIDRVYGEKMVETAGPERQRHLEQVMANDGHLAELSRQAKEKMAEPSRG